MKRFKKILAVFDRASGSLEALDRAGDLAVANDARLGLMVCLTEFGGGTVSSGIQEAVIRGLQGHFDQIAEGLRARGITVSVDVLIGRPFIQIIRRVLHGEYDLVVKMAEHTPQADMRFGSTDLHLLRKCPVPVWLLRPHEVGASGPVLAAVAPSMEDNGGHALNLKILELASSLARQRQAALHVLQAWPSADPVLLRALGWADTEEPALKQQLTSQRSEAEARFHRMIGAFGAGGLAVHAHFENDAAAKAVIRCATEHGVGLLVMSTVTRPGIPGLLIGQTAEDVLRQLSCAVLCVKPDRFVSPVAAEPTLHSEPFSGQI